ncbi:MAG: UDP-3-O-(3-hydroxymyristoyl)glucosamine N-acyltransferase, partial [Planctomycetota bacterium]|nr:UDP-3-O-(3-hydroxymyristoyl)glucosamine N-acyltransferase [Planctomycetota bacterium]
DVYKRQSNPHLSVANNYHDGPPEPAYSICAGRTDGGEGESGRIARMAGEKVESLKDLCSLVGGELEGDGDVRIRGVAPLASAQEGDIAFLFDPKRAADAARSSASALVVSKDMKVEFRAAIIRVEDPAIAFALIARRFHPIPDEPAGVDPRAAVEEGAWVAPDAYVGPFAVVRAGARIESGCRVYALAYIGRNCRVGPRSRIYPGAVLYDGVDVGADVVIHASTVIGADGFGYRFRDGRHVPIPQVGRVVLGDAVEIGANSAVDRATMGETLVGEGTKIDNLVQVGHNCRIGRHCILCGQAGLAGSVELGDYAILAANAGVADHRKVGAGAQIGAKSGVHRDVPPGARMLGLPAREAREAARVEACVSKLPELVERLRKLEERIAGLESRLPRP